MAEDRLPSVRSELITSASSDNVMCRPSAISRNVVQNAPSRLTLVLRPATMTERLTIEDFIARGPVTGALHRARRSGAGCDRRHAGAAAHRPVVAGCRPPA